jgi:hypothetical protein
MPQPMQLAAEVFDLADPRPHVVVLHALDDAARHRLHVAAGHAAVGVQALEDDDQVARLLVEFGVVERQPAADVDQRVLLAAHRAAVGVRADQAQDLGDRRAGVAGLALLDEPRVLDRARGVEDDPDAVALGELADRTQVGQRDRLAAGHVHGGADGDVRDARGADPLDERGQRAEVDVALERMLAGGVVRLGDDDVDEGAAGQLLVQAGGGEVHVAGHDVAGLMSRREIRFSAPRPWCVGTTCA